MKNLLSILFLFFLYSNSLSQTFSQKIENVTVLSKTIGCLKYFYPSKTVKSINWEKEIQYSISKIEKLKTQKQLKDTINKIFINLVPDGCIITNSEFEKISKEINNKKYSYWEHLGYGFDRKKMSLLARVFISNNCKLKTEPKELYKNTIKDSIYTFKLTDSLTFYFNFFPSKKSKKINNQFTITNDTLSQLSSFIEIWNVIQHFYPYRNELAYDWSEVLPVAIQKIYNGLSTNEYEKEIRSLLFSIGDRHIGLGKQTGKDIYFYKYIHKVLPIETELIENKIVITSVNDSLLAIKQGDIILEINNYNIDSLILNENDYISNIDKLKKRNAESILNKYINSNILLTLKNCDSVYTKELFIKPIVYTPKTIRNLDNGYIYIDLSLISKEDLEKNIDKIINSKGVIADARYRTGIACEYLISCLIDSAVSSGNWYKPKFRLPNQQNIDLMKTTAWKIEPNYKKRIKSPIVFLTGDNCYSRGETNMDIIKHYQLGTIVGQNTAGNNGDINLAYIGTNYLLVFSQLYVLNRDGSTFFGKGISPDIIKEPSIEEIKKHEDYLVDYALEYLKKN